MKGTTFMENCKIVTLKQNYLFSQVISLLLKIFMKHSIYLTLLLLLTIVLVSLPLVKVPISVSARGIIRPLQEDTEITSPVSGRVIRSSLRKNNQSFLKGDTLLVVTTELLDTQRKLLASQTVDYTAQIADLSSLTSGTEKPLLTAQYQQERNAFSERIAQLQAQLSLAQKELARAKQLYNAQVIALAEYEKVFYRHEELLRQVQSAHQQQLAQWRTQQAELTRKLQSLQSDTQRIDQQAQHYVVLAPITGTLTHYKGLQIGSYLNQGQSIANLSPEGNLVAECMVSPKDIGFIHNLQPVLFQIDTYNYNQWGLLQGAVEDIDNNLVVNEQTGEGLFRIRCRITKNYLSLKNGYKGYISKGMSLTARFHLTDRTLWQLLFDRTDNWLNPNLK